MTIHNDGDQPDTEPREAFPPQGHFAGVPYDWRRPTKSKYLARFWNSAEPHLFLPKAFGAGWTINFYWLLHPFALMKAYRANPKPHRRHRARLRR